MKEKYIDHYGIDSLPNLRQASAAKRVLGKDGPQMFVTTNQALLEDREELEKRFDIKIRTPGEVRRMKEVS